MDLNISTTITAREIVDMMEKKEYEEKLKKISRMMKKGPKNTD